MRGEKSSARRKRPAQRAAPAAADSAHPQTEPRSGRAGAEDPLTRHCARCCSTKRLVRIASTSPWLPRAQSAHEAGETEQKARQTLKHDRTTRRRAADSSGGSFARSQRSREVECSADTWGLTCSDRLASAAVRLDAPPASRRAPAPAASPRPPGAAITCGLENSPGRWLGAGTLPLFCFSVLSSRKGRSRPAAPLRAAGAPPRAPPVPEGEQRRDSPVLCSNAATQEHLQHTNRPQEQPADEAARRRRAARGRSVTT